MNQWLQLFRGATRPVITLALVGAFIIDQLFGNPDSAELGVMTVAAVTWWFSDRSKKQP